MSFSYDPVTPSFVRRGRRLLTAELPKRRRYLTVAASALAVLPLITSSLLMAEFHDDEFHLVQRIRGQQVGLDKETGWPLAATVIALTMSSFPVLWSLLYMCDTGQQRNGEAYDNDIFWVWWGVTNFFASVALVIFSGTNDASASALCGLTVMLYAVIMHELKPINKTAESCIDKGYLENLMAIVYGVYITVPIIVNYRYNDFSTSPDKKDMVQGAMWVWVVNVWLTVITFNVVPMFSEMGKHLLDEYEPGAPPSSRADPQVGKWVRGGFFVTALGFVTIFILTLVFYYEKGEYSCHDNTAGTEAGYCTWGMLSYSLGDQSGLVPRVKVVTKQHWAPGFWGVSVISFISCIYFLMAAFGDKLARRLNYDKLNTVRGDWMWLLFTLTVPFEVLIASQAMGITEIWEFGSIMAIASAFHAVLWQASRGHNAWSMAVASLSFLGAVVVMIVKWEQAHRDLPGGEYDSDTRLYFVIFYATIKGLHAVTALLLELREGKSDTSRSLSMTMIINRVHTLFFLARMAYVCIYVLTGGILYARSDASIATE